MSLLRVETEQLQLMGYRLSQTADSIYDQVRHIEGSVQLLLNAWRSAAGEQFQGELEHTLLDLRRLAYELDDLAARLRQEATKWEAVDHFGRGYW